MVFSLKYLQVLGKEHGNKYANAMKAKITSEFLKNPIIVQSLVMLLPVALGTSTAVI